MTLSIASSPAASRAGPRTPSRRSPGTSASWRIGSGCRVAGARFLVRQGVVVSRRTNDGARGGAATRVEEAAPFGGAANLDAGVVRLLHGLGFWQPHFASTDLLARFPLFIARPVKISDAD